MVLIPCIAAFAGSAASPRFGVRAATVGGQTAALQAFLAKGAAMNRTIQAAGCSALPVLTTGSHATRTA
jgi:hypothetical protein